MVEARVGKRVRGQAELLHNDPSPVDRKRPAREKTNATQTLPLYIPLKL